MDRSNRKSNFHEIELESQLQINSARPDSPPRTGRSLPSTRQMPQDSSTSLALSKRPLLEHAAVADEVLPGRSAKAYSWPRLRNVWIREYFVIFLSVGCMVAIAIIVLAMHDRPLSRWKLPIAPNALISVFATISKSTMLLALAEGICQLKWVYFQQRAQRLKDFQLFDEASRGPWGSLKLISAVKLRASVASFGALIVILSLAVDPFVQQIMMYRTRMIVAVDAKALIGTAQVFDSGSAGSVAQSPSSTYANDFTTASSDLLNSLVRGLFASNTDTAYQCSAGNCTWQPFDTLGVCSECQMSTSAALCNSTGIGPSIPSCVYNSYSPDPYGSNETLYAVAAGSFECSSSTFAQIWIVHRDEAAQNWGEEPAYNCSLSFCRKAYNQTSYNTGILSDNPAASEALAPNPKAPPVHGNTTYLCPFRTEQDETNKISNGTTYWINANDIASVGLSLVPLFWTSLSTTLGANNYVASALYRQNGGNITTTMDAVATSMTNQIRQGPNATQVSGTALVPETYIHVSWLWLLFPTLLVFLACAFLTVTMGLSTRKDQVVWKSSSLATLFHSMHGSGSNEAGLKGAGDMQNAADEMYAFLHHDDDGRVAMRYTDKDGLVKKK